MEYNATDSNCDKVPRAEARIKEIGRRIKSAQDKEKKEEKKLISSIGEYSRRHKAWKRRIQQRKDTRTREEKRANRNTELDLVEYDHSVQPDNDKGKYRKTLDLYSKTGRLEKDQISSEEYCVAAVIPRRRSKAPFDKNLAQIDPLFEMGCTRRVWDPIERRKFLLLYISKRGDLRAVKKSLPNKSMKDVVNYYYRNALDLKLPEFPKENRQA